MRLEVSNFYDRLKENGLPRVCLKMIIAQVQFAIITVKKRMKLVRSSIKGIYLKKKRVGNYEQGDS